MQQEGEEGLPGPRVLSRGEETYVADFETCEMDGAGLEEVAESHGCGRQFFEFHPSQVGKLDLVGNVQD